jgi:hypothetical protein
MKPIKLLLLVSALCFWSCSSDDDSNSSNAEVDILGTWTAISVEFDTASVIEINGQGGAVVCNGEGYDIDTEITFTEEPNEFFTEGDFSVMNDCTPGGESVLEDVEALGSGTWTLEGDQLILTEGDETIEVDIDLITEDQISLSFEQEVSFVDGPINTTTTINAEIVLDRN